MPLEPMPYYPDKAAADYKAAMERRKKKEIPIQLGNATKYDTFTFDTGGRTNPPQPPVSEYSPGRTKIPYVDEVKRAQDRGERPFLDKKNPRAQEALSRLPGPSVPEPQPQTPAPAPQPLQRTPMDLRQSSRADAVRREMLQRQVIREKQTPFVQRDASGNIDPRVAESWALNDKKYAADRAASLSTPQRLGTAAGARATDQAALDELMRQRTAEAQGGVPVITNPQDYAKANQYRDPSLRSEYFLNATRTNADTRDKTYAEKDARLVDLDRRIAEYKQRLAGQYAEPVPSETARMDQLARRDAYISEADKLGENVATQRAYNETLAKEMRDAQLRQVKKIGQETPEEMIARGYAQRQMNDLQNPSSPENAARRVEGIEAEYQVRTGLDKATVLRRGSDLATQIRSGFGFGLDDSNEYSGSFWTGSSKPYLPLVEELQNETLPAVRAEFAKDPQMGRVSAARLARDLRGDQGNRPFVVPNRTLQIQRQGGEDGAQIVERLNRILAELDQMASAGQ